MNGAGVFHVPVSGGAEHEYDGGGGEYLAIDTEYLYWTSQNEVKRAPRGGGTTTVLVSGIEWAKGIAVNDTHVAYLDGLTGQLWALKKP